MGLFGKREPENKVVGPPEVVVGPDDIARLKELLQHFEAAQLSRSDSAVRHSLYRIAIAGGAPDFEETFVRSITQNIDSTSMYENLLGRAWHWLAAVARTAEQSGESDLVAHISVFVLFFTSTLAPLMQMADEQELRLTSNPPERVLREVYTIALRVLPQLPQQRYLVGDERDGMSVGDALRICLVKVVPFQQSIDPRLLDYARSAVLQLE